MEMEFLSDKIACIKELRNTKCKEEIELAIGLQTYIIDYINQDHSALLNMYDISEEVIREGPASQPQSTLSRCKNLPPLLENSDPP